MMSLILKFIFDHPLKQLPTGRENERKTNIQNFKYLQNEKSFLDEIKSIF